MRSLADALKDLRERHRGDLITADDSRYDQARLVWNAMIDKRPAIIARPRSADDVIAAVQVARSFNLPIAVRGGGHSVAGRCVCDDGLVIDFADMKAIRVDPVAKIARAEPGLRWTEFDRETQAVGLATTGGTIGDTGIAGLTLGGGFGWLEGKFGMTVDNVIAADVVLADGRLVRATSDEHSDLFWAIRGGGGNFGVVTGFRVPVARRGSPDHGRTGGPSLRAGEGGADVRRRLPANGARRARRGGGAHDRTRRPEGVRDCRSASRRPGGRRATRCPAQTVRASGDGCHRPDAVPGAAIAD